MGVFGERAEPKRGDTVQPKTDIYDTILLHDLHFLTSLARSLASISNLLPDQAGGQSASRRLELHRAQKTVEMIIARTV